jgi:lactate dehydrogenase-like 2-hydroxyacid dehydrogenase
MIISIFLPQQTFSQQQVDTLKKLGDVRFSERDGEMTVEECIDFAKGSDILGLDPDNLGGFEHAKERITKLLEATPTVKGVALATTSFGWIDRAYCKNKGIPVSNVPGYSREAVAEHTIAMLLCMAKRILITDRRTQKNAYVKEMGFELKGKTLGIIGIGNIGSRTAEIAQGIGMKVIAHNRTPKTVPGVEMKSLEEVLKESDAIAFHTTHEDSNKTFIKKEHLGLMKKGVIIVNTADREIIDEEALAAAITSGQVDMYAFEAENLTSPPLGTLERAIGLKGFGYYTKEAIVNLYDIFITDLKALVDGKPQNVVN